MSHVVLFGDSILDNGAYVPKGSALVDQLRAELTSDWTVTLLAQDGSVIADVLQQLNGLPASATHLVVSAGGNDVLAEIAVLGKTVATVGEGLRRLADIRDRFEHDYERLCRALVERELPAVVATIYNPRFSDPGLEREAVTALCLFNDCIIHTARRAGLPVLDLRPLCNTREDFATPIEPSTRGAAKICSAIRDILHTHDFSDRRTTVLPRSAPGERPLAAP